MLSIVHSFNERRIVSLSRCNLRNEWRAVMLTTRGYSPPFFGINRRRHLLVKTAELFVDAPFDVLAHFFRDSPLGVTFVGRRPRRRRQAIANFHEQSVKAGQLQL